MRNAQNSAKILDFQSFKERQTLQASEPVAEQPAHGAVPMIAWYPVWVFVPQFPQS